MAVLVFINAPIARPPPRFRFSSLFRRAYSADRRTSELRRNFGWVHLLRAHLRLSIVIRYVALTEARKRIVSVITNVTSTPFS